MTYGSRVLGSRLGTGVRELDRVLRPFSLLLLFVPLGTHSPEPGRPGPRTFGREAASAVTLYPSQAVGVAQAAVEDRFEARLGGVEHVVVVRERPAHDGPLEVRTRVATSLRAERVAGSGQGLRFVDDLGAVRFDYSGLKVYGADRLPLASAVTFEPHRGGGDIVFRVQARGARFPLVIDPLLTSPAWTADSPDVSDIDFGESLAVGDVNGDGWPDILVGALGADPNNRGSVWLYLGTSSGPAATPSWSSQGEAQDFAFFGAEVALGDVDGDGDDDAAISAYGFDTPTSGAGKVYVYLGGAGGLATAPAWTSSGDNQTTAAFGGSLALGDVNGDTYADLLVGAHQYNEGATADVGKAYLYLGSAAGLSATAAWTATGDLQASAGFGSSVAIAGDVNGDGRNDAAVSASSYTEGAATDCGKAYVFHGTSGGLTAAAAWTALGDAQPQSTFGGVISGVGDVSQDGFDDLAVIAPNFDDGAATNVGKVYLYRGSASGLSISPAWTTLLDRLTASMAGATLSGAGDVTGDGIGDFAVGAPGFDSTVTNAGKVYVFEGSTGVLSATPVWTSVGADLANAFFGTGLAGGVDHDGDGRPDLLVGANGGLNGSGTYGRVALYTHTTAPSGPTQLAFVSTASPVEVGACSPALRVEARSSGGAPETLPSATPVDLSPSGGSLRFYSDPGCLTEVTGVTILAGQGQMGFYFVDTAAGTPTITATAAGLSPATQGQTVVLRSLASPCGQGSQCQSGTCAQGVCCASACGGPCVSCALSGTEGTCSPVGDGTPCGNGTFCDGAESCEGGSCAAGTPVSCVDPLGERALLCSEATQSCEEVPGNPPLITEDAILTASVGTWYPYSALGRVHATGSRPLVYSLCGGPPGFRVDAQTGVISWLPQVSGVQAICLEVTNAAGADQYAFDVNVASPVGAPPVAAMTVTPGDGPAPLSVLFDSTGSSADPATPLAAFRWRVSDGRPDGTGATYPAGFEVPGGYVAVLTVIDAAGRTANADAVVRVRMPGGARPPTARIVASAIQGSDSLAVTFSCDCAAGDASLVGSRWLFGATSSLEASPTHTFGPGRYHVRLTVTDAAGLTATDTREIVVTAGSLTPPRCDLRASPAGGLVPVQVRYAATYGDDDGAVVRATLAFDDGLVAPGPAFDRSYTTAGRRLATLLVEDDDGLTCQGSAEVVSLASAAVLPPAVMSAVPQRVQCGELLVEPPGTPLALGAGPVTWSLARGPPGAGIDAATGALRYRATRADVGSHVFERRALGAGGSAVDVATVEVTCPPARPLGVACGCGQASPGWAGFALLALIAWSRRGGTRRRRSCDGDSHRSRGRPTSPDIATVDFGC
jgi:PKD repeat protein